MIEALMFKFIICFFFNGHTLALKSLNGGIHDVMWSVEIETQWQSRM